MSDPFLNALKSIPVLSLAEEHQLAKDGDINKLVKHNLRYVVSLVSRKPARQFGNVDLEDLISAGYEGLINAAKRWEPREGIRFIGYAKPFIERAVTRCIENTGHLIRLPVNVCEEIRRMRYQERLLLQQTGEQPSIKELAKRMKSTPKRIHELRSYILSEPKSLDAINTEHLETDPDEQ